MKKNIFLSFGLSASILVSSCFSVPFVSAETTNNEQIEKLLESFIEQNYKGDARVYEENDFVHVEFRKTSANEPYFDTTAISEDFDQFFKENNIDSSLVVIRFLEGIAGASPVDKDTELVTEPEKIYDIVNSYVEENLSGDANVIMTEEGKVLVTYRQPAIKEPEFDSSDLQKFLLKNNVDFKKITILHLADTPVVESSDTNKITDPEKIAGFLKKYIDENHPGDATVAIHDEDDSLHVTFRNTAVSEDEFDGESIYRNMIKYLEENNVDQSYISNKFSVLFRADAKEVDVPVIAGDIDLNGTIDVTDLTELSLVLVGDKELTEDQKLAADIDGDGAVTLADLARLQQYLSKKINAL